MLNWPEMLHHAEHWANSFWTGAELGFYRWGPSQPRWRCSVTPFEARQRVIGPCKEPNSHLSEIGLDFQAAVSNIRGVISKEGSS